MLHCTRQLQMRSKSYVIMAAAARFATAGASGPLEPLSVKTLNPAVVKAEYAVRGPVLDRAMALQAQLDAAPGSLPFNEIVQCNIGKEAPARGARAASSCAFCAPRC